MEITQLLIEQNKFLGKNMDLVRYIFNKSRKRMQEILTQKNKN